MSKTYFIPNNPPAPEFSQWRSLSPLQFTLAKVEISGCFFEIILDLSVPEDRLIILDRRVADAIYPRRRRDD